MSALPALAKPHRIKASHRRRRKVTAGHCLYIMNNPLAGTDPTGYAGECSGGTTMGVDGTGCVGNVARMEGFSNDSADGTFNSAPTMEVQNAQHANGASAGSSTDSSTGSRQSQETAQGGGLNGFNGTDCQNCESKTDRNRKSGGSADCNEACQNKTGGMAVRADSNDDVTSIRKQSYGWTGVKTKLVNGKLVQDGPRDSNVGYAKAAEVFISALTSTKGIYFKLVHNDPKVVGDDLFSGLFDVGDFDALNSKSHQEAAALFTHVLSERMAWDGVKAHGSWAHEAAKVTESGLWGGDYREENYTKFPNGSLRADYTYINRNEFGPPTERYKTVKTFSFTVDRDGSIH